MYDDIEKEYEWILKWLKEANLKETTDQVIEEKIEIANSTISDMNNEIIKIEKEPKIKNFFIAIFTLGKINKNKENKRKIMKIEEKINKLQIKLKPVIKYFNSYLKNKNCQKWVNSINKNQTENSPSSNFYSKTTQYKLKVQKGVI